MDEFGQLRVLDELVSPPGGQGAKSFSQSLNRLLAAKYRGYRCLGWGDPAGNARSPTDESTWLAVMSTGTGFVWRAAPSNKPLLRLESVRAPLSRLHDGRPGFLLSPTCKVLRRGFNSGYRFRRVQTGGGQISANAGAYALGRKSDSLITAEFDRSTHCCPVN